MFVRHHNTKWLYLTTALAMTSTSAIAQTAPENAVVANTMTIETVVVTAEKRSQNVEKVPMSITAFDESLLKSLVIDRSEDLPKVTPSLRINNQIGYALLSIRGVGNFIVTPGAESDVAVYIDGVYQNNLHGGLQDFFDLQSVEILKGPQGTLYGRNATAGVINYITKEPSLDAPEGKIEGTVGNKGLFAGQGYFSTPINEQWAVSVSAGASKRNSYQRNVNPNPATAYKLADWESYNVRGKLLYKPNENTKFLLSVGAQFRHDSSTAFGSVQTNPFGLAVGGTTSTGFFDVNADLPNTMTLSRYNYALTIDHNFGDMTLTSISAYSDTLFHPKVDNDQTNANVFNYNQNFARDQVFTQELRLASNDADAPFTWMIGGFYYNDMPSTHLNLISGAVPAVNYAIDAKIHRESWSAFAQSSVRITDALKLTVGVRETTERDALAHQSRLAGGVRTISPNQGKDARWNSFTYHAGLDYDFGPAMVYATVGTGFKSGNFNTTDLTNANPVSPEKIINYEAGIKGNLFDRRVVYTAAAFLQDYSNMQVQIINTAAGGATQTQNAAKARIKGIEADIRALLTEELTIFGALTILDPTFTNFPNYSAITMLDPSLPPGTNVSSIMNVSGNRLPYASKFSANVGFDHLWSCDWGSLNTTANAFYTSKYYSTPDNQAPSVQEGYWDIAGSITLRPAAAEGTYIKLWGKNLLDKDSKGYMNVSTFSSYYAPNPPRTFGLTVGYEF